MKIVFNSADPLPADHQWVLVGDNNEILESCEHLDMLLEWAERDYNNGKRYQLQLIEETPENEAGTSPDWY